MRSVTSPTPTTSSVTTSSTISSSLSQPLKQTKTSTGTGNQISELFSEIDWDNVNLIGIEAEWRAELEQIEKENVQALMDTTSKAQVVLPTVSKAIEEMTKLSTIYEEYTNKLRLTGLEIQQIEFLNRGLETQTKNQEILLAEVEKIVSLVALPDGVLEILQNMPFDSPTSVSKIERAAKDLYKLLNIKFEDGIQDIKAISDRLKYYSEQHDAFARRLVKFFSDQFNDIVSKQSQRGTAARSPISLPRHDEIYTFLSAYKSLILQSRHQCPREHLEICSQYQSAVGNLISKDFTRLFEALKTAHLLKRPNPEPSSLFVNPTLKSSSAPFFFDSSRSYAPSNKNFSSMRLFQMEDLPFLSDNEFVYPDQAMQYIILIIGMNMVNRRKLTADLLFGISSSEGSDPVDLKISKKLMAIQGSIYAALGEKLPAFVEQCIKLDESASIDILAVLDTRTSQCTGPTPILAKILEAIQQKVYNQESQLEAIRSTKYSAKKRTGIFSYVETFPRFIARIEGILSSNGIEPTTTSNFSVRTLIDRFYEKVSQTIFESFEELLSTAAAAASRYNSETEKDNSSSAAAIETDQQFDEKGRINANVMTIENSHFLLQKFTEMKTSNSAISSRIDPILKNCKTLYEESLNSYAKYSIYRVLGKFAEYFEGLTNLLKSTAPEEVAFTSAYSKASVKKVLAGSNLREIKKSIELLHQRTVKHFTSTQLQTIVWKALQDDLIHRHVQLIEGISKVFPGAASTDLKLSYSIEDLKTALKWK